MHPHGDDEKARHVVKPKGNHTEPPRFGPYTLVRPLPAGSLGPRWLTLHEGNDTSHVVHLVGECRDRTEANRFCAAAERAAALEHAHVLPIEHYWIGPDRSAIVVTPYVGHSAGLVHLDQFIAQRDGALPAIEVERILEQTLQAVHHAHEHQLVHGPLDAHDILVDRRGSVWIELYALGAMLGRNAPAWNVPRQDLPRNEVRSVLALAYRALTGVDAGDGDVPPSRYVRKLSRAWDAYFQHALDAAGGHDSALDALNALPSRHTEPTTPSDVGVRTVLRRFRLPLKP